jgi:hypothetical protein
MKQPLTIVHNPPGYKMEIRISPLADQVADRVVLDDRYVVIRTGDLQAIALNKNEVKRVIDWLQEWLNEEEAKP